MSSLIADLITLLPRRQVITEELRRFAYGTDASFYRLVPQVIAVVENEAELLQVLKLANLHQQHLTFRAAGTSLSGQAITDGLLILIGEGFSTCEINPDATTVRLGPGIIGAEVNRRLAPFNRKIGPDPASIDTCKIGGIAANNASGMCCGTAQNSYQTVQSMRVVLVDGSILDTADTASVGAFRHQHAALLENIAQLGRDTCANPDLSALIRKKYKIKNTTGYSLNSLVDFEDPLDILTHLMIGSEGTLGFISSITYRTVPEYRYKSSALVFFKDIASACEAVIALKPLPVSAVEILDRASLRSVESTAGLPSIIKLLDGDATALLIEVRGEDEAERSRLINTVMLALHPFETIEPVRFSIDPHECDIFWKVRKGTFPSVGAMRQTGTTVIIEDVAFPVENLANATLDLRELLTRHGYQEAIIFGHALEGNLHFVFTQNFADTREIDRYRLMMDEVCALVVGKYQGSLKAEHGTGRNMAPFVELEWGHEAMALMRRIKSLFDPENRLNPGVIINDNPKAHLGNLKPLPAANAIVDKCIECGFCEPQCPSHQLTLSPRQRIVGLRELSQRRPGTQALVDAVRDDFTEDYRYMGLDTCAGCGLCATACPVGIDTGAVIRLLRGSLQGPGSRKAGKMISDHFGVATFAVRTGLRAGHVLASLIGNRAMGALSAGAWRKVMPSAGKIPTTGSKSSKNPVIYIPGCGGRMFGNHPSAPSLSDVVIQLLERAGFSAHLPDHADSLCCGQPFASKGLDDAAEDAAQRLEAQLLTLSENGCLPIVMDASPCAGRMKARLLGRLKIQDFPEFAVSELLPRLSLRQQATPVALHLNCSARRQGEADAMYQLASACAEEVIVPTDVKCCGFGGDRGFQVPELNIHALRHIHKSIPAHCHEGVSSNRTCELGLTAETGITYQSIAFLLERASRPV